MKRVQVRKVAVLGAGVMGAQIAAHLVNVKVPVVLFDLPGQLVADGPRRLDLAPHAGRNLQRRRESLLQPLVRSPGGECLLCVGLEERECVLSSGDGRVGHLSCLRCNEFRQHCRRGLTAG